MNIAHQRQHILTVNLEDYYQVGTFNRYVQRNRWQRFESRVEVGTERTLELLAQHTARATFFVLGWVAEQYPTLIRRVADAGHEVAVRGYFHRGIHDMTPDEFAADAARARATVEDATGRKAVGYRLADGWLQDDELWALDVLTELGFEYDSSIARVGKAFRKDSMRGTPHIHEHEGCQLVELPVSCGKAMGFNFPVAGGNYLRQLPHWVTRRAANKWVRTNPNAPLVAYFHTWEMDPDQPRLSAGGRLARLRHYRNLDKMPSRVAELLRQYRFGTCAELLGLEPEPAPPRPNVVSLAVAPRAAANGPRVPVSVVVPCYNEEAILPYLQKTLAEVREHLADRYEIQFVLVDDGSTDSTWAGLQQRFADPEKFTLLRHDRNLGVAAGIMTGLRGSNTEIVCSMDSDCSYDPLKLGDLIPHLSQGVDLVTASPYHPQGSVKNVPGWRLWLSKGCAWMYRRVLRAKLHTYTSCFRVYRRSTVAALPLRHNRYLGIAELIGRLSIEGGTIVEVPATLEARVHGRSKMKTMRTIFGHLGLMIRLMFTGRHPASTANRDEVIRGQLSMIRRSTAPALEKTPSPVPASPLAPVRVPTAGRSPSRPVPPVSTPHH